jgi:predicted tellurium resistance membrane protein TerC
VVSYREATLWSLIWIGLALAMGVVFYLWRGPDVALQFFTGYVIEKLLSVDNIAGVYHVPIGVSLGVIALILTSAIVASLLRAREAPGARVTQTAAAHRGDQQNRPRRAAR